MLNSGRLTPILAAVPAVFCMWILQYHFDLSIVKIGIALSAILIVLSFLISTYQIGYNLYYFGISEFRTAMTILRKYNYVLNHQADRAVLIMDFLGTFVFVEGLAFNHWWIIISLYYFVMSKATGVRYAPPFVVALGESGELGEELVKSLTRGAFPLAVKELLRFDADSMEGMGHNIRRFMTTFRVDNEVYNWQFFVGLYCRFTKLIVLDVRNLSVGVEEEIAILKDLDLWYKVLIISKEGVGRGGGDSRFDLADSSAEMVPMFYKPSELYSVISAIAKNSVRVPSKERPIWEILSSGDF